MSTISEAEVRRLAGLARIGVTDNEAKTLALELEQIVGFVEQLQDVDLSDVDPTSQVTGLVNVLRDDTVRPSLPEDKLTLNAPAWQDGQYRVKRVLT